MRWWWLSLALIAGCTGSGGTYVLLTVESGPSTPAGVAAIDLHLDLDGKSATGQLTPKSGELHFPTTASLEIRNGSGTLTINAIARDAQGAELDHGSATTTVVGGKVNNLTLQLGLVAPDDMAMAGNDLGGGDLGTVTAALSIDNNSHDYGTMLINASQSATFRITHSGSANSGALTTALGGANAGEFMISTDSCMGSTLVAGAFCDVAVLAKPTSAGTKAATITVSGSPGGSVMATLSARAITPGSLSITPDPVPFGSILVGTSTNQTITVRNSGGQTSGAISFAFSGSGMSNYALVSGMDNCTGAQLSQNQTCTAVVKFTAGGRGDLSASIVANATPGGPGAATLAGAGLSAASLSVSQGPASTDFGTVDVGLASTTQTFTVRNDGDITTGALSVTGATSEFVIVSDTCTSATLMMGATCSVGVQLQPSSYGAKGPQAITVVSASPATSAGVSFTGTGRDQLTLTAATNGSTGSGTVTAPTGTSDGISCPGNCSENYYRTISNPTVTLTAVADANSTFTGWSEPGCPLGMPPYQCTVTFSANKTVTASFTKKTITVTVTRTNVIAASTGTVDGTISPASAGSNFSCAPGGSCGNTWTFTYDYGSSLTIVATPTPGYWFGGWGGDCSGFNTTCQLTNMSANKNVTLSFTPANVIFVTASAYTQAQVQAQGTGATQGVKMVSGADALCKSSAAAGSKTSGLGSNWVAWISHTGVTALSRLNAAGGGKIPRGWVRTDGKPFGDAMTTMGILGNTYQVFYPPENDENGNVTAGTNNYWTGTDLQGNVALTCSDWTDSTMGFGKNSAGDRKGSGYYFSNAQSGGCDQAMRLACLQADYVAAVRPPPPPAGARMALVATGFALNGLANADAACATAGAAYGGTFKAALATTGASAAARLAPATGANVYRPDGVILGTDTALLGQMELASTWNMLPNGTYLDANQVLTGSSAINTPGSATSVCQDANAVPWNSTTGNAGGGSLAGVFPFTNITTGCTPFTYIFCLK